MPMVRPEIALRKVSLNVPAPAGDSFEVRQWMRKRPVSLDTSPTVLVPRPCHDPTVRVTATIGLGSVGVGEQPGASRSTTNPATTEKWCIGVRPPFATVFTNPGVTDGGNGGLT